MFTSTKQNSSQIYKTELHKRKQETKNSHLCLTNYFTLCKLLSKSDYAIIVVSSCVCHHKTNQYQNGSPTVCIHNYTHITGLISCLIYSVFPLLDCTADIKQLCRASGSQWMLWEIQIPIGQDPIDLCVQRETVHPHSGLLLTLCPCLCNTGREGGFGGEKIAFYCLSIYWQIA